MKINIPAKAGLIASLLFVTQGCATLSLSSITETSNEEEATLKESPEARMYRALQTARESNSIVLQVEGSEKPLRVIPLPKDGKPVFMNDLLRQAGLIKRFSSLDITLFRSSGSVMDGVKMSVIFDRKAGRVKAGTDYALRPGDRVAVRHDNFGLSSFIDDLVPPVARKAALR